MSLIPYGGEDKVKKLFYFEEFEELNIKSHIDTFRNKMAHYYLNIVQNSFFLLSVGILWIEFYVDKQDVWSIILSYTLFYITDDWKLIFKYSLALKGRILKKHVSQIVFFNVIIAVLAIKNSFSIHWILGIVYLVLVLFTVRLILFLMVGFEGLMTDVSSLNWKDTNRWYDEWTGEWLLSKKNKVDDISDTKPGT